MNGEDFLEGDFAADLTLQPLDLDLFARRYPILFSPTANYGVHTASRLHCQTPIISVDWPFRQRPLFPLATARNRRITATHRVEVELVAREWGRRPARAAQVILVGRIPAHLP